MKNKIRFLGIIALLAVIGLVMTACDDPMGPGPGQGDETPEIMYVWQGAAPWICVNGFWHIGGTPSECNANCTGIAATFGAGQNQLFITEPTKKTYVTCVSDPLEITGLIVSFQIQSFIDQRARVVRKYTFA